MSATLVHGNALQAAPLRLPQEVSQAFSSLDRVALYCYFPMHYSSSLVIRSLLPLTKERLGLFGNSSSYFLEVLKRVIQCALVLIVLPLSTPSFLVASLIDVLNTKN